MIQQMPLLFFNIQKEMGRLPPCLLDQSPKANILEQHDDTLPPYFSTSIFPSFKIDFHNSVEPKEQLPRLLTQRVDGVCSVATVWSMRSLVRLSLA